LKCPPAQRGTQLVSMEMKPAGRDLKLLRYEGDRD
jgi:hypothetical protein